VVDPASDGSVKVFECQAPRSALGHQSPEAPLEVDALAALEATMVGVDDESEEGNALGDGAGVGAVLVEGEAQPGQEVDDGGAPLP